jgi:hypothetical protein
MAGEIPLLGPVEFMNMYYHILQIIFDLATGDDPKMFFLLRMVNRSVKHHVEVIWARRHSLHLTANTSPPYHLGDFTYFAVNRVPFPKLLRLFNSEAVPTLEGVLEIQHGSGLEQFLEFMFQHMPKLSKLTLEHSIRRGSTEKGFHLLYTFLRRLIQRYNIVIYDLDIQGAPLIPHPSFGLIPLINACSSILNLTLDDMDKFTTTLVNGDTFDIKVDTLSLRRVWPPYHSRRFGLFFARMPNLRMLKMVVDWKQTYPVEGRHTIKMIQDFISCYRSRDVPAVFILYPFNLRNARHFGMILEILAKDNPGASVKFSERGVLIFVENVTVYAVLVRQLQG